MRDERPGLYRTKREAFIRVAYYVLASLACFVLGAIVLTALCGCTDADSASWASRGKDSKVTLWSGGEAVREWVSSGKVQSATKSSLLYFKDKKTGLFVKLRGTISIETLED